MPVDHTVNEAGGNGGDAGGPIFLAGVDRSGIGLLGEILEMHPDVSMTRRTRFWSDHAGRHGDLTDSAAIDRALDAMLKPPRMAVLEPDRERLHAELSGTAPSYPRLFESLQIQLMQRRGRIRWGDKSLAAEQYAPEIFDAYPDARMVHVLRDPRDRFASQKHHRNQSRGGVGAGSALWRWSERLATTNQGRFAGRYHVIRYEDMVTDTDSVLDEVRRFLCLSGPAESAVQGPELGPDSIGRFHDDISSDERRIIELMTRRGMARRGYPRQPRRSSLVDSVRFWSTRVPLELAHALVWRIGIQRRHNRMARIPARSADRSPQPTRTESPT